MTHSELNEDNPFAHQPKSFDWHARGARAHPWKQVPPGVFRSACEELASILEI